MVLLVSLSITLIYDLTFNSWSYENDTSELVLAMNEAINGGYYDPSGNYGDLAESVQLLIRE